MALRSVIRWMEPIPTVFDLPVYTNDVVVSGNAHLKAIAYKPGWYSSDTTKTDFYGAKYRPDSVIHLLPPDNNYKDEKKKR